MVDILLEILLEVLLELTVEGSQSKKIPVVIRHILRVIVTIVFVGLALVFGWIAFAFDGQFIIRVVFAIGCAGLLLLWVQVAKHWISSK